MKNTFHARCIALWLLAATVAGSNLSPTTAAEPEIIRCAVIGGMVDTNFWQALSERFEKSVDHRYKVKIVSHGPKHIIDKAFRTGQADLITMHASDTIINLVADGYAVDPQPWLKNDLVIVGPHDDPAGVRSAKTARSAFAKIAASKSTFVVHASLGAQEVMREILNRGAVIIPSDQLIVLFTDRARDVLRIAAQKHAYTMVGRIPFLSGKMKNEGLELMFHGDPEMRRPYVVTVASAKRFPNANVKGATALAHFLRTKETQDWIRTYGVHQLDDQSLFFPVEI